MQAAIVRKSSKTSDHAKTSQRSHAGNKYRPLHQLNKAVVNAIHG
jgi:hypothetical protein